MKQGTNLGSQIGRWIILAALVVVLGALLLTIRPLAAQSTGDCEKIGGELQCSYLEHSTGHVYDFHAATAGAEIAWTLVGDGEGATSHPDFGDFRIDQESGVLIFKSPPNYESPMGGGTANNSNTYMVMVKVEVDTDAGRTTTEQGVTVNVTNKEEDGSVTLNNLQPQVRELLTATLSDPDGSQSISTWQWSSSSSSSGSYTPIAGATAEVYRPVEGDTGMYLRATVTYTDAHGPEVDTAMTAPMNHPVRAETGADNAAPLFAEDADTTDTGKTANRAIDENTPAGTNIGPPVFATDDDLDVLTYSLSAGADRSKFAINAENGQLMTKASLNFEAAVDSANNCAVLNSCVVEVTVKDPLGNRVDNPALDTITVTIAVNNLNEAPTVSGPVLLIRHPELNDATPPVGTTVLDTDLSESGDQNADFTAKDQESTETDDSCTGSSSGSTCSWELEGPDADSFTIGDGTGGTTFGRLAFRSAPDLEKPGDANEDNVYQVTVVARDGQLATGSRDVTVRVTNKDEGGTVSLSHVQPEVATSLIATLSDPDDGITGLKWQWYRGSILTGDLPTTACVGNADTCLISGAKSKTYTPKPSDADTDRRSLTVTATYDDAVRNKDDADTTNIDESQPTVVRAVSDNTVRAAVSPNPLPKFIADGDGATATTTAYTRYVRENRDIGTDVSLTMANAEAATEVTTGADVTATDDDNEDATDTNNDQGALQYELGGAGKDYFTIDQTTARGTAVTIQTKKILDREDKNRHTVTVKVTDPSGGTATATVTIIVVNEDEAPVIDNAGPTHVEYMENGTAAVANYMATDPESKAIVWSLSTDDDGEDLKVIQKSGPRTMLGFKKAPDFEMPGDANTDKVYAMVLTAYVVDATDPTSLQAVEMDTVSIMVGVTDVPEAPAFSDDSDTLTVDEHTKANTDVHRNVGSPVTAKDSDGDIHLTYSLSGTDAGYFTIVPATGQIKTMMKLDYETKNSFRVVVTATDPTDRSDTINITIEVDDVAEAPDIVPDGVSVSGETDVDYNENSETAVGTYEVAGPEAATARWTLEGPDASHFRTDGTGMSTMLKFRSAPDFEMPRGQAMSDTNTNDYMVTVKAEADGDMDMTKVTITVMNSEEDGTVTLMPTRPSVGTPIMASVTDLDVVVENTVSWVWASSDTADGTYANINGATSATYTPVDDDAGKFLRATATYDDGYGSGNTEMMVTEAAVTEVPVNVAPEFADETATRSIAENTAADTAIGDPVAAIDSNGDTLAYTLEGTDAASFSIDGSTGQLRTSATLNYEAKSSYSVVVRATDPAGESDTIEVTIDVTDVVNEAPTAVETYDTNGTAGIQIDELFDAIDAYFDESVDLSIDDLFEIIDAYFANNG